MSALLWAALAVFMISALHALLLMQWRQALLSEVAPDPRSGPVDPVIITLIVPARNAAPTLPGLLQDLYAQRYPKENTEVLVVDDHSEDGTTAVVRSMMRTWPQLRLVTLSDEEGKKAAIEHGVRQARGELILLTDADARCDADRSQALAQHWSGARPDLVLMPVRVIGSGMLGAIQEEEQLALLGAAVGGALTGTPFLANGTNMAFTRSAFAAVGGYAGDPWASGDDVFLLRRMRDARRPISYLLDRACLVTVEAENAWGGFVAQRLRWAGKMRGVPGYGKWLGATALLLPWMLALVTMWSLDEIAWGRGLRLGVLILLAWMLWMIPVVRLVDTVKHWMDIPRHRPRTILSLLAFSLYAPILAVLSLFLRPRWKGRRT